MAEIPTAEPQTTTDFDNYVKNQLNQYDLAITLQQKYKPVTELESGYSTYSKEKIINLLENSKDTQQTLTDHQCNYINSLDNDFVEQIRALDQPNQYERTVIGNYNNALETNIDNAKDNYVKVAANNYLTTNVIKTQSRLLDACNNTKVIGGKRKLKSKRNRKTKKRSTRRRRRTAK